MPMGSTESVFADLSPNQIEFFQTFGYLRLREWLRTDLDRVNSGFADALAHRGWRAFECGDAYDASGTGAYDAPRLFLPFALDRVPTLTWLRHHERIAAIARSLVGEPWAYATSDTNIFNCDTKWHHDGFWAGDALHIQVMLYLDPLDAASGALRVIPGSHLDGSFSDVLRRRLMSPATIGNRRPLGIDQRDFPAQVLDVVPGDVVVIDLRSFHASFGGTRGRRVITIKFGPPQTRVPEAVRRYVTTCTTGVSAAT